MSKVYVMIAQACESCGGRIAISVTSISPDDERERAITAELGGMFCISVTKVEVDLDGNIVEAD